jgi:DNA-binding CsgD family transcriptional regulator
MSPGVLVGRDAEITQLRSIFRASVLGQGRTVLIEGEPGIGKSALVDVVADECVQLGVRVLHGRAEEMEQQISFAAIASCLGPENSAQALISSVLRGGTTESDRGSVANLEFAVTEAILDQIEQWCSTGPVALLLDDLQWADPATFLVLHRLGRTIGQVPLLMVGSFRPVPRTEEMERLLRSLQDRGAASIHLGPLSDQAVAGLIERLGGGPPGPKLRGLVAGAAGNPLYLTELVSALIREGRVRQDDGVLELTGPDPDVPQSLPVAIMRRLDFLSRRARDVLEVAAVLGPGLKVTELSAILDTPASELLTVVREAVAAGLLSDFGDQLMFRHDLIRRALAENVPTAVRAALRMQAAQALAGVGAPVDRVAQYLLTTDTIDSWVLDWLVEAAEPLTTRAPTMAVELLGRAAARADTEDGRLQALRFQMARALLFAGRPEDAEQTAQAAMVANRDPARDAALRWLLAQAYFQQGRLREAQIVSEEALASAVLTTPELARFQHFAAQARLTRGYFDLPAAEAEAQAMIDRGDPDSTAYGLYYLSGVRWIQERMADSLELMDRATVAFGTPEAQPDWDVPIEMYRAYILLELDRDPEAEKAFETGLRQAERHGSIYLNWYHLGKARLHFLHGRWDDALAEIQAGLDSLDTFGKVRPMHTRLGLRSQAAIIAIHRGDRTIAAAVAKEARPSRRAAFYDYLGQWAKALAWEAQGESERALDGLAELWDRGIHTRIQGGLHYVVPDMVRLALAIGRADLAGRLADDLAVMVAAQPTPTLRGILGYSSGFATGDPEKLLDAADILRGADRPLYQAYAQEAAAAVLAADRSADRTTEARAALAAALDLYDRLDATWDASRARARLREAGIRSRRPVLAQRAKTGWEALTDTERKVAELVAEGYSNPDIAARMFISRRTVQSHVSSILTKLNVTSRVELAVTASRHGAG